MGTSYVEYNKRGYFLNDGHYALLLHMLARSIDCLSAPPSWLIMARDCWDKQAALELTGAMSASLDEYLTTKDKVGMLVTLAEGVRKHVINRVTPLSEEKGHDDKGKPKSFVGDVPKSWVLQGVEALICLLKGNLPENGDSVIYLPRYNTYELLGPSNVVLKRLHKLWMRLEREQLSPHPDEYVLGRVLTKPWESKDGRIRRAWEAIIARKNLGVLERWAQRKDLRRFTREEADMALRQCRAKE